MHQRSRRGTGGIFLEIETMANRENPTTTQPSQQQAQRLIAAAQHYDRSGDSIAADILDDQLRSEIRRVNAKLKRLQRMAGMEDFTGQGILDLGVTPSSRAQEDEISFRMGTRGDSVHPLYLLEAFIGEKQIGYLSFQVRGHHLKIGALRVAPDVRRRGIANLLARKMLDFIRREFTDRDISTIDGYFDHKVSYEWAEKHFGPTQSVEQTGIGTNRTKKPLNPGTSEYDDLMERFFPNSDVRDRYVNKYGMPTDRNCPFDVCQIHAKFTPGSESHSQDGQESLNLELPAAKPFELYKENVPPMYPRDHYRNYSLWLERQGLKNRNT